MCGHAAPQNGAHPSTLRCHSPSPLLKSGYLDLLVWEGPAPPWGE